MSLKALPKLSLLLSLILLPIAIQLGGSEAGEISVYWGQNVREGNLSTACKSGNYDTVNIAYLSTFGNGTKMVLNITDHCINPGTKSCLTALGQDIKECQSLGVKVLLSIGGDNGNYSLASIQDARKVAKDIWNSYLGGTKKKSRPLGDAILDGVDFDIQKGIDLYWAELATTLRKLSGESKLYLSATSGCSNFDYENYSFTLRSAAFDSVSVKFYNDDSCEYTGSVFRFMSIWGFWSHEVPATTLLLGLPPSGEVGAARSGYVSPSTLVNTILPQLENNSKFGGLMLSSRYYDLVRGYSSAVKPYIHNPTESS